MFPAVDGAARQSQFGNRSSTLVAKRPTGVGMSQSIDRKSFGVSPRTKQITMMRYTNNMNEKGHLAKRISKRPSGTDIESNCQFLESREILRRIAVKTSR